MHLLRCEDNFFSSFLSPWLLTHQASPTYQDTVVYCKDGMVQTNRLVMGLIFPQLGNWQGFSLNTLVEVILPDWEKKEAEERIERLFGSKNMNGDDKEFENWVDANNRQVRDESEMDMKTGIETKILTKSREGEVNALNEELKSELSDIEDRKCRKKWTCHNCSMAFRYMDQLQKHAMVDHQLFKFLRCQYCDFETNINKSLQRHENNHTAEKEYNCVDCTKTFLDPGNLRVHMTTHSTTGPVKCDMCEKSLKSTFCLRRHKSLMHRHIEDQQESEHFICEVCSSVLKSKDYLKRHMKNVHSGNKFMCSMCDKKFKRNAHLNEHEKFHLGEIKTSQCTICAFAIRGDRNDRIQSHMKTHYNTNSLKCDKCEYYFRSQIYLIQHVEIAHSQ